MNIWQVLLIAGSCWVVAFPFVALFAIAMCRAAANGDKMTEDALKREA